MPAECAVAGLYQPRDPRSTPLYRLVEAHYEEVKSLWDERFEPRYGAWRGFVDGVVMRYLDCGIYEAGLARVQCPQCHLEYLIACSCKGRTFCPSCAAKRATVFATFLREEVLEPVCHQMWTFSIPRMIRPYFMNHRRLLTSLCHAAYETVHELMAAATPEVETFRTGMVATVQTAGDALGANPHVHAIVPRGGWGSNGAWVPVPFVDTHAAELLFRHKVLSLLTKEGLLCEQRAALLLSWNNHTGFSVDSSVKGEPEDAAGLERMARYIVRPPLSLDRMSWEVGAQQVAYTLKPKPGQPRGEERIDPLDFLARLIAQIPAPRLHLVHYLGHYSSVARGRRRKGRDATLDTSQEEPTSLTPAERRASRRAWAKLIKHVYQVDPLICKKCGSQMRIISVILDPAVIKTILDHVRKKKEAGTRAPPQGKPLAPAA